MQNSSGRAGQPGPLRDRGRKAARVGIRGAQLPLVHPPVGLPLDPRELGELSIFERIELYTELGLDSGQREAAEAAVRIAKRRAA